MDISTSLPEKMPGWKKYSYKNQHNPFTIGMSASRGNAMDPILALACTTRRDLLRNCSTTMST